MLNACCIALDLCCRKQLCLFKNFKSLAARIDPMTEIAELLKSAINDMRGFRKRTENIIKKAGLQMPKLTSYAVLLKNGGKWLRDFESAEKNTKQA